MTASPKLITIGIAVKGAYGAVGASRSQGRECSRRRIVGRNVGRCGTPDGRKITGEVIRIAYGAASGDEATGVSRGNAS